MVHKNNNAQMILSTTLKWVARRVQDEWPPKCAGLLYQPIRTVKQLVIRESNTEK